MSCVNTSSREFKSLLNSLGISSGTLEMELHKMQNEEALEKRAYPTASEIISRLSPKPFEASLSNYKEDDRVTLWLEEYSKPRKFLWDEPALDEYLDKAISIYGRDSVNTIELNDGSIMVQVGRPSFIPVNLNQGMFYELKSINSQDSRDILLNNTIQALERVGVPHINVLNSTKVNPYTNGESVAEANPFEVTLFLPTLIENMYQWEHIKNGASSILFKSKIHHELEHSITISTFRKVEAGRGTKEEVRFYNEMSRLWNLAKNALKNNDSLGLDYFKNSIDEFASEIMSNQKLQRELAKHKDPKSNRTILHSIIDAIAHFFSKNFGIDIKGSILESSLIELSRFHNEIAEKDNTVQSKSGYPSLVIDKLVKAQERDPYGIKLHRNGNLTSTKYIVHISNTEDGKRVAESKIQGYEGVLEIGRYNSRLNGYEVNRKVTQETIDKRNATRRKNAELREQHRKETIEREYAEQISYEELLKEEQKAWQQERSDQDEYLLDILASKDTNLYNQVLNGTIDLYDAVREYERLNSNSIYAPSSTVSLSNNESQNNLALNFKPEEAEFYSGAATGSDKAWEEAATKAGIKVKNYTVNNWDKLSNEERERLDKEYQEVVNTLGRKVLDINSYSGKLVRRDMLQADKADAIFAIGKVASNGYVDGGTGYATTRGIIRGIPVYLFDQSDSTWKVWNKEQS